MQEFVKTREVLKDSLPDADFDGESVSSHEAPVIMEPLTNGIPHGILAQLNKLKAMQNDARNRKKAADNREARARKAAKAAKAARKKSR